MKTVSSLLLISLMSIHIQANQNSVRVVENPNTQKAQEKREAVTKKRDIKPSPKRDIPNKNNLKPKTELDKNQHKYPGVEWKPKDGQKKYPGVEWKPKAGDPIKGKNLNTYPGVEWTPKK